MKRLFFTTVLLICFLQLTAFCQTDSAVIKNAVSKLRTLLTDHITEKAYLQLDRPYACYVAGEIVYFKAYVIKGERHELTDISGILHVDLINNNNTILKSVLVQLNNGAGWGDFALPDTLNKGNYRIRGYTEWMRNEKHPDFFEQSISVSSINSAERPAETSISKMSPALQFFPEGGTFVTDISSKVAFKAIGSNGLGINVKGVITDNNNKEVAKIESQNLGMGVFSFIAEQGMQYKASVVFGDGSKSTINLPTPESKGITLAVTTSDTTKVHVDIKTNRDYYKANKNKPLNLVIYWAGSVRTISTRLDYPILALDIPAGTFRTGILQITLLSETGEPLNERIAFIQKPDLLNLSFKPGKSVYAPRESVELDLTAKNKDGNPVNGYFSVSVVDESKVSTDETAGNSILSYLLLTSDLKGYIEKPNYYFSAVNSQTRADLDVLMLTQGYRRFVWKELLNDNLSSANNYQPEQYLNISGALTTKTGKPISNSTIDLLPFGEVGTTDAKGQFTFEKVNFDDGANLILKTNIKSAKNGVVVTLDKPLTAPSLDPSMPIISKYNPNADILASFQNNQTGGVITASSGSANLALTNNNLEGVKKSYVYRSSSLAGPGHADQVITGDEIKYSPTLSTGLNGRARGINFVNGIPYFKNSVVLAQGQAAFESMLLVVDGTIIGVNSSVDYISPSSVETVEVLKENNAAIYGLNSNAGVMVITTKQGGTSLENQSNEMSPGMFAIRPDGYFKAREFYSPNYSVEQNNNKVADNRVTIFWKPDLNTSADGKAKVNYFNSDGTGTYRVEVEGIDNHGNLGRQVFRYKVQ